MLYILLQKFIYEVLLIGSQIKLVPRDINNICQTVKFNPSRSYKEKDSLKVLVIVHAYWPHQFREIIVRLNKIKMSLTVAVAIPESENSTQIVGLVSNISKHHKVNKIHVSNNGRNVGSLFRCIDIFLVENWDLVIMIHTKASQKFWFKSLLKSLIMSDRRIYRHVMMLEKFPNSIIVHPLFRFPGHRQPIKEPATRRLRNILKRKKIEMPKFWFFPAGFMFSASPKTLISFKNECEIIGIDSFESEENYTQGSTAHVCERYIGVYLYKNQSSLISTSIIDFLDLEALIARLTHI